MIKHHISYAIHIQCLAYWTCTVLQDFGQGRREESCLPGRSALGMRKGGGGWMKGFLDRSEHDIILVAHCTAALSTAPLNRSKFDHF